jgi:S-adenosylmethionine synthetase
MKKTAEFVSPMHPDKICDLIADGILDAYLEGDKNSRCAIEVMGGHGFITINGEVTSKANPDVEKVSFRAELARRLYSRGRKRDVHWAND